MTIGFNTKMLLFGWLCAVPMCAASHLPCCFPPWQGDSYEILSRANMPRIRLPRKAWRPQLGVFRDVAGIVSPWMGQTRSPGFWPHMVLLGFNYHLKTADTTAGCRILVFNGFRSTFWSFLLLQELFVIKFVMIFPFSGWGQQDTAELSNGNSCTKDGCQLLDIRGQASFKVLKLKRV